MALYAYLRVSTDRQDVDNQRDGLLEYAKAHALGPLHFVEDAVSGRLGYRGWTTKATPAATLAWTAAFFTFHRF